VDLAGIEAPTSCARGCSMPQITVTLVDHTNSPQLMPLIQKHLEDIFKDLLFSQSEAAVVNIRSIAMLAII
jgi:hypothetical protein